MAAADSLIGDGLTDSPYTQAKADAEQWQSLYVTRSFVLSQEFAAIEPEPSRCDCANCTRRELAQYRALRSKYTKGS